VTDHEGVRLHPLGLVAINGHQPVIFHNVTVSRMTMICDTCGWMSRSRSGRWRELIDREWRVHAGDLAMGIAIAHGAVGNGCHCYWCDRATRLGEDLTAKAGAR
jgi:hypothetical protein